jgi:hypothetical protein
MFRVIHEIICDVCGANESVDSQLRYGDLFTHWDLPAGWSVVAGPDGKQVVCPKHQIVIDPEKRAAAVELSGYPEIGGSGESATVEVTLKRRVAAEDVGKHFQELLEKQRQEDRDRPECLPHYSPSRGSIEPTH